MLQLILDSAQLLELSKEHELPSVSAEGVSCYIEEYGKTCFQASSQFDRPTEFLQSLLDIIRVNYEPCVLGTFFLNSNMAFLYEEIPNFPFQLGYVSITSEENIDFFAFWHEIVIPYAKECGYNLDLASAIYAVASTGEDRYGIDYIDSILTTLDSGFSVDEAMTLLTTSIYETNSIVRKKVHTGYCLDPALGRKTRLSLWLFMRSSECTLQ